MFHPVFWDGAIQLFTTMTAKVPPIADVQKLDDAKIKALVDMIGAEMAGQLSTRLQSLILFYESRILDWSAC